MPNESAGPSAHHSALSDWWELHRAGPRRPGEGPHPPAWFRAGPPQRMPVTYPLEMARRSPGITHFSAFNGEKFAATGSRSGSPHRGLPEDTGRPSRPRPPSTTQVECPTEGLHGTTSREVPIARSLQRPAGVHLGPRGWARNRAPSLLVSHGVPPLVSAQVTAVPPSVSRSATCRPASRWLVDTVSVATHVARQVGRRVRRP